MNILFWNGNKRSVNLLWNQNRRLTHQYNIKNSYCSSPEWKKAKPFKSIPGPQPNLIFGNTLRFMPGIGKYGDVENNLFGVFDRIYKEFGDVVRLDRIAGMNHTLYLYNPDDIEKVYKIENIQPHKDFMPSFTYFRENIRPDIFQNTKSLINANGDDWQNFRKKVKQPMLNSKIIHRYFDPVDDIAQKFIQRIKSIRGRDNKVYLDVQREFNKWSLESISYLALNKRMGCLENDLPEYSEPAKLIRIVDEVFIYSGKLDFQPSIWKYVATPTFKKAMKVYDEQTIMCEHLIAQSLKEIKEKNDDIQLNSEESVLEKLSKIDKNVAVVMAIDMLLAGVDTTATNVLNLLYYLAINPSVQKTLKNEIKTHLPENDSILNIDMIKNMKYLRACIKEAARMYPVVPGIFRNLTNDHVISGYRVPKGTRVMSVHMHSSMNEKYVDEPHKFIPERWLRDDNSESKRIHPFCSLPFGFGSRSCIGRRFAELEIEVVTVNFMRNFDISWDGPPPKRISTIINLLKDPFHFVFENARS